MGAVRLRRTLASTALLALGCQPATSSPAAPAPEAAVPERALVRACVDGPGMLRLSRRGEQSTLSVGDGECEALELAPGERVSLQLSEGERASTAVVLGVVPGFTVSFQLPSGPESVQARFSSETGAAELSRLATDYALRGRVVALAGGQAASVQADDAWTRSEAADSGLVSDGHRVIWAVSILADRSRDVEGDLPRLRAFARDLAPESPARAIEPELPLVLAEAGVLPNAVAEAVRAHNPDPSARAAACVVALRNALDRSDYDHARTILAELDGNPSSFAQLARTYDPTAP